MTVDVPLDEEEFRRWRREAGRTLESARHQAVGGFYNWACFAAEQAAQLAVKGFLHGIGRGPWGHDLVGLVRALADAGAEVSDAGAEAALRLSRHYIPARYPDTHPSGSAADRYGAGDAAKAVEDAELILKLVDSGWEELGA